MVLPHRGEDFQGYTEEKDRRGPHFHKPERTLYILSAYSITLVIVKDASQTFGLGLSIPTALAVFLVPVTKYKTGGV